MEWQTVFAAFLVGLAGAGHCLGMCGGIVGALSLGVPQGQRRFPLYLLLYNCGRIFSYGLIGAVAGLVGGLAAHGVSTVTSFPALRIVAGILLLLMGLYVAGWWRVLVILERLGGRLWSPIQALSRCLLPIDSGVKALASGVLWGWLPCGLVYSALGLALVQEQWYVSVVIMMSFGLGTFPALIVGGLAGHGLKIFLQSKWVRSLMGVFLILFGLWTMLVPLAHMCCGHFNKHAQSSYTQDVDYSGHHR